MEATFGKKKKSGKIITVPAGYRPSTPMTGTVWKLKLSKADRVMVQCYDVDETKGMMRGDVVQDGKNLTITFSKSRTGYPVLVKPAVEYAFYDKTHIELKHNLGRWVCAQIFLDGTGQAMGDVHNVDENTVTVDFNQPMSGYLLVA